MKFDGTWDILNLCHLNSHLSGKWSVIRKVWQCLMERCEYALLSYGSYSRVGASLTYTFSRICLLLGWFVLLPHHLCWLPVFGYSGHLLFLHRGHSCLKYGSRDPLPITLDTTLLNKKKMEWAKQNKAAICKSFGDTELWWKLCWLSPEPTCQVQGSIFWSQWGLLLSICSTVECTTQKLSLHSNILGSTTAGKVLALVPNHL